MGMERSMPVGARIFGFIWSIFWFAVFGAIIAGGYMFFAHANERAEKQCNAMGARHVTGLMCAKPDGSLWLRPGY